MRGIGQATGRFSPTGSKGKQVDIPALHLGATPLGFVCGNTKELEAGKRRRRQRFLFCLKR